MGKKIRKVLVIFIVVIFAINVTYILLGALFSSVLIKNEEKTKTGITGKEQVVKWYEEHADEIKKAIESSDIEALYKIEDVQEVDADNGTVMIECGTEGYVTDSSEYGIVYEAIKIPEDSCFMIDEDYKVKEYENG